MFYLHYSVSAYKFTNISDITYSITYNTFQNSDFE